MMLCNVYKNTNYYWAIPQVIVLIGLMIYQVVIYRRLYTNMKTKHDHEFKHNETSMKWQIGVAMTN